MKKYSAILFLCSLVAALFLAQAQFIKAQTVPPAPSLSQPTNGSTVLAPVVIVWGGAVNPYYYTVWRNGSAVGGCADLPSTTMQCTDSDAGGTVSYTVSACAGPGAANYNSSSAPCVESNGVNVVVSTSSASSSPSPSSNPPPAPATPTPAPYPAVIGTSYTFSTSLYPDPNGLQVKAVFDWGDGTTSDSASGLMSLTSGSLTASASHAWSSGGVYNVRVKEVDASGLVSGWSATVSMTVGAPPNPPSLSAALSGTSVVMNWTESSANVNGFRLYRKMILPLVIDQSLPDASASVSSYADFGLSAGTYSYYMQAYNLSAGGSYPVYSQVSNDVSITVPSTSTSSTPTSTVPNAPTNLNFSLSNSNTTINLNWNDNSSNETRFEIYWQPPGGNWFYHAQVGGNVANFSETPGVGTYYYQVAACNGATLNSGCSGGSNVAGPITILATSSTSPLPSPTSTSFLFPSQTSTVTTTTMICQPIDCAVPPQGCTYAQPLFNQYGCAVSCGQISCIAPASTTIAIEGLLQGIVNDPSGHAVGGAYVHIYSPDFSSSFSVITGNDGSFTASLPEGTYLVTISAPASRNDLLSSAPQSVMIASGASKTIALQFGVVSKTITGTVAFSTGQPVIDAQVGAYSITTQQWVTAVMDGNGHYSLSVNGGTWQVGVRPMNPALAQWSSPSQFPQVVFAADSTSETQTVNFSIPVAGAQLTVHTMDQDGNIVQNAGVVVDTQSAGATSSTGLASPPIFRKSDANGLAAITLSGGTYYLRAFLPPEAGYFNPPEQQIGLNAKDAKDVSLIFRRQTSVAAATSLRGVTKIDDGTPASAFVWAWSEAGGAAQGRSDSSGVFSLSVIPGRWHIGAGKEGNNISYKSSELTVDVGASGGSAEIILSQVGAPLPPVVVSQSASQQIVAQETDGASVNIPAGAAKASGNVNLQISPTVEAPTQAAAKVVSTVYDVNLTNASGTAITAFQQDIVITIPYSDADLAAQGTSADKVVPSYYDQSTGTWVKVDSYAVDKVHHQFVVRVKHLTRFALIAAADITPPASPTNVQASAIGRGIIRVSWTNPSSDFDHVKVYRSMTAGDLGKILANNVSDANLQDANVTDGTMYYYTVVAVDPAGNESTGNAVSVVAQGTSGGVPGAVFPRNLRIGSHGDDVKALQALLVKEGVYPEAIVSGYFGKLTSRAVARFQEKYADDILKPNGLSVGTGFVGVSTRAKMNQLLSQ